MTFAREEPQNKGSGLLGAINAVRTLATPEEWARTVAALSPEARVLVETPPLPVTWIPARRNHELIRVAHEVAFGGNDERLIQAARLALRNDLSTLYRVFIRLASPQFVIDRSAKLWDTYNRHNGKASARQTSPTTGEVRYEGVPETSPAFWTWQRGAILGVLDATGVRNPHAIIVAGGGTSADAVIEADWGKPSS